MRTNPRTSWRTRRFHRPAEILESRRLFAVDLVVQQLDELHDVTPGERISYQVALTNNGPDNAYGVAFRDPVSQSLRDVTWTRDVEVNIDLGRLPSDSGVTMFDASRSVGRVKAAGDLNGDGLPDYVVERRYVVFGSPDLSRGGNLDLNRLNGTNGFKINTEERAARLSTLAGVGDINADGFDDLVVNLARHPEAPSAHVIFGGPSVGQDGNVSATAPGIGRELVDGDAQDGFYWVSSAGDFNNDGVDDLVLSGFARSYLVYGRADLASPGRTDVSTLDGTAGFIIGFGGAAGGYAGDLNDDGIDDVVLGVRKGESVVLFGGKGTGGEQELNVRTLEAGRGFLTRSPVQVTSYEDDGIATRAGDVNRDGIDDLIQSHQFTGHSGTAYVIFGGAHLSELSNLSLATLDGTTGFRIDGAEAQRKEMKGMLGVSSAGDFDGDGYGDIVVGVAPLELPGLDNPPPGEAYLLYGGPTMGQSGRIDLSKLRADAGFQLNGYKQNDYLGRSVAGPGDVNADGFDDILISTDFWTESYLVLGHPNTTLPKSGAGDIDDTLDVRVGATVVYTVTGTVVDGKSGRLITKAVATAPADQPELDPANNLVPDLDPGLSVDLLVELSDEVTQVSGDERVEYQLRVGNQGRDTSIAATVRSPLTESLESVTWTRETVWPEVDLSQLNGRQGLRFVLTVSPENPVIVPAAVNTVDDAGDVNADGFDDLILGSRVILGPLNDGLAEVNLSTFDRFFVPQDADAVRSVAPLLGVGDVDGDGIHDLISASHDARSGSVGGPVAYVLFGREGLEQAGPVVPSELSGADGFLITAPAPLKGSDGQHFLGPAGDINNDGAADFYVVTASDRVGEASQLYIVFGGARLRNNGRLDLTQLDGSNGVAVETPDIVTAIDAGRDINGDGADDVVVGHSFASPDGKANAGLTRVLYGGANLGVNGRVSLGELNGSNGFVIPGEAPEDYSGKFTRLLGDINGDGFGELMIGAYTTHDGQGGAYVIFGKSDLGSTGSFELATLDGSNGFFFDVLPRKSADAGDINGDGLNDVIVGSARYYYTDSRPDYVIFGSPQLGAGGTLSARDIDGVNGFRLGNGHRLPLASAGDMNHDGIGDIAVGNHIIFGVRGLSGSGQGVGDINESHTLPYLPEIVYTIQATVPRTAEGELTISAVVEASPNQTDIRPANNRAIDVNQVLQLDLETTVIQSPTEVTPGQPVTFVVNVKNQGQHPATVSHIQSAFDDALTATTWARSSDFELPTTIRLADPETSHGVNIPVSDDIRSLAAAGDINGDGIDDFVVGAPWTEVDGIRNAGTVSVVFGRRDLHVASVDMANLDGTNGFVLTGFRPEGLFGGDLLGISLGEVGDLNGDGFDDLAIGALNPGPDVNLPRSVVVVFGRPQIGSTGKVDLSQLDGSNGFVVDFAFCCLGPHIAVGDFTADGVDDLVLGADQRLYLLHGGPGIGGTGHIDALAGRDGVTVIRSRAAVDFQFPSFLRNVGDVNGDQIDDLAAAVNDASQRPWQSYVVFGGANLANQDELKLADLDGTNGFVTERRGRYELLDGDMDVNGDNISDLVFGDPSFSDDRANQIAYLVFGRPGIGQTGMLDPSQQAPGDGVAITTGSNVWSLATDASAVGDANGDGLDDLLIRAQYRDRQSSTEAGYLIYGDHDFGTRQRISLDALRDEQGGLVFLGEPQKEGAIASNWWWSITSPLGDVNGDGLADFMIGVTLYDPDFFDSKQNLHLIFGSDDAGIGEVRQLMDIPAGGSVTYTINGLVRRDSAGPLRGQVTATPGLGRRDANTANNTAEITVNVRAPLTGDIDLDGRVDFSDFLILSANYSKAADALYAEGDLDGDGAVLFSDFLLLSGNFGASVP